MNIHQIDQLINSLDRKLDKNLIKFYKAKRKELMKKIFKDIADGMNKELNKLKIIN